MAVLRFEPAGLDLDFLYEGQVDAGAEWAIGAGPNTDTAEGRVVDGHAVCDVQVLKTGGAGNGRILRASADTRGYAGGEIK